MKCGYFFLPEAGFIFSLKGHCDKTKTHLRRGIIYLWSGSPLHSGTLFIFLIFCGQISPSVTSFLSDIQCWFWVLVEVWPHYTYCLCFSWKSRLETWMIPQITLICWWWAEKFEKIAVLMEKEQGQVYMIGSSFPVFDLFHISVVTIHKSYLYLSFFICPTKIIIVISQKVCEIKFKAPWNS